MWLEAWNLKRNISNLKFAPKREGPFTITDVLSPITYRLHLPQTWKIHHIFHASLLSPYCKNTVHGLNIPRPPPNLIAREEKYEINRILRHRGTTQNRSFLIRWEGYSAKEDSWTPEENLSHATEILQEYKKSHPSAFSPRIRVISTCHTGLPQPTPLPPQILLVYPSSHCHYPRPSWTYQLFAPSQYRSRKPCPVVLPNQLLPISRHLETMPCSYSDEPEFFIKEKGGIYPCLTISDIEWRQNS